MKGFIFLVILAASACSKKVSYKSCSSEKLLGETLFVDISPCDEDPCVLKRGNNETITTSFKPHETVRSAKIFAYANNDPLPIWNPNACEGHGLACPLKDNIPVKLVFTQKVKAFYPSGTYKVKTGLKDQNGAMIVCVVFDLKIA